MNHYLDNNDSLFKKCYDRCETCEIKGDNITHNCVKCNDNYPIEININNYLNCYENCSYYYYFDDENLYHCTEENHCPIEYPILLEDENKCEKKDYISTEIINNEYTTDIFDNVFTTEKLDNENAIFLMKSNGLI